MGAVAVGGTPGAAAGLALSRGLHSQFQFDLCLFQQRLGFGGVSGKVELVGSLGSPDASHGADDQIMRGNDVRMMRSGGDPCPEPQECCHGNRKDDPFHVVCLHVGSSKIREPRCSVRQSSTGWYWAARLRCPWIQGIDGRGPPLGQPRLTGFGYLQSPTRFARVSLVMSIGCPCGVPVMCVVA